MIDCDEEATDTVALIGISPVAFIASPSIFVNYGSSAVGNLTVTVIAVAVAIIVEVSKNRLSYVFKSTLREGYGISLGVVVRRNEYVATIRAGPVLYMTNSCAGGLNCRMYNQKAMSNCRNTFCANNGVTFATIVGSHARLGASCGSCDFGVGAINMEAIHLVNTKLIHGGGFFALGVIEYSVTIVAGIVGLVAVVVLGGLDFRHIVEIVLWRYAFLIGISAELTGVDRSTGSCTARLYSVFNIVFAFHSEIVACVTQTLDGVCTVAVVNPVVVAEVMVKSLNTFVSTIIAS